MKKVYLITEEDLELLQTMIDRDPQRGYKGCSSGDVLTDPDRRAHEEAHRFYNYQVVTWVQKVQGS